MYTVYKHKNLCMCNDFFYVFSLQKFSNVVTPDKKASQKIGLRLRNLLKLPKAHKWCIYEWFYSNIDR